jgi:hypothetical protein
MAYNGYGAFGDEMEGIETSGPKVTVREVGLTYAFTASSFDPTGLTVRRWNKINATSSYNPPPLHSQTPCAA